MRLLTGIWYSFAFKLVLLQLKRHHLILSFWLVLFLIVSGNFGTTFGMPYLFLDPEYLGKVGWLSFFIMGAALGGFIMAYQITGYILNSYRFPFLATLQNPFFTYLQNNAFIPALFLAAYIFFIVRFQLVQEFMSGWGVIRYALSLVAGVLAMVLIASTYFFSTNKNVFSMIGIMRKRGRDVQEPVEMKKTLDWDRIQRRGRMARVDTYLTRSFRARPVRGVEHYDEKLLLAVFRQHHINALLVEILILASLIAMGYLMDYKAFIIPAGASILVLFATLIMLIGAFNYWTGRWRTTAFIVLLIVIGLLMKFEVITYHNRAVGLDYSIKPAEYSHERIAEAAGLAQMERDKQHTLLILDNWRKQAASTSRKPIMVFVQASGGGHRAALWAIHVMQVLDSLSSGEFSRSAMMMTGASGGMYGLAYYRELMLRKSLGEDIRLTDVSWLDNIAKDLLNPICFTIVVNDLFYPWQSFRVGPHKYRKDRAYMFDKHFNLNTNNVLNKAIKEYHEHEAKATIPMLILSPTVISDERKLFISPQPVSYLCRPAPHGIIGPPVIDGIDFGAFFREHGSYDLLMTNALRMNATYPYILPNVTLPSEPHIQVMDAGIRDNYGLETTARFVSAFREWIQKNTDGVLIVSFNSVNKALLHRYDKAPTPDAYSRLVTPVSNLYENWTEIQRYNQQYLFTYLRDWMKDKAWIVEFNYTPQSKEETTSMSFHLTSKEKKDILSAIDDPANKLAVEFVLKLLGK